MIVKSHPNERKLVLYRDFKKQTSLALTETECDGGRGVESVPTNLDGKLLIAPPLSEEDL